MPLLAAKLRNAIHRIDPLLNCSHVKNVSINGVKVGCSGFVLNPRNSRIAYVATDTADGDVMYRAARSMRDFTGGPNQWARPEEAPRAIVRMLDTWDDPCWERQIKLANNRR